MDKVSYVATAKLEQNAQEYFNTLRKKFFPVEKNLIHAHLTLFHFVPESHIKHFTEAITAQNYSRIEARASALYSLGKGVAFKIESDKLMTLRHFLANSIAEILSPQDRQRFNPHITIQNKVSPSEAKRTLEELSREFRPYNFTIQGVQLWEYQGGPWKFETEFTF